MKKFKNIDNFKDAEAFLKKNFECPIFSDRGELNKKYNDYDSVRTALENVYNLLKDAKNSAVRAAIHKVLIGGAVIDYNNHATGVPYYSTDELGNVNYLGQSVEYCMSFRPIEPDGFGGTQYSAETIGQYCYELVTPLD